MSLGSYQTAPVTFDVLDVDLSMAGHATRLYRLRVDIRRPSGRHHTEIFIDTSFCDLLNALVIDLGMPPALASKVIDIAIARAEALVNGTIPGALTFKNVPGVC